LLARGMHFVQPLPQARQPRQIQQDAT
jgi:hypothetical protein